jgi:serine/threonine protein kinase
LNRELEERDPESEVAVEIAPGQLVAERFRVLSLLGKGGMGSVYLVEQIYLHKRFALKTLLTTQTSDKALRRFQQEAKATSLLSHQNLVRLHEFGLINGVQPYFVMELCEGETLADLVKAKGKLSEEQAINVFITICNALAYAHSQGIVHRDLKPSNIMITTYPNGKDVIKVLDFGIAKVLRNETEFNTLTRTGEIFGSPYYMSPEQCLGKAIDSRSDIYSLGCMFFEILTGTPPFMGDNALSTMLKHQSEMTPSLKEATLGQKFPTELEQIVGQMLSKDPEHRYQNMLRVADDLQCLQRGEPTSFTRSPGKVKKSYAKQISIASAAAVAVLAIALLAYFSQPTAKLAPTVSRVESKRIFEFPSIEKVREVSKATNIATFYSDQGNKRVRKFHFPARSIGKIDGGESNLFIVAANEHTLQIPLNFELNDDPMVLSGFRKDEVGSLSLRGLIVDDSATDQIKHWGELKELDIARSDIGDRSIMNLQTLPKLTSLNVGDTHVSATGLRQLHLEKMRLLNADRMLFASELLPKLRHSKVLTKLFLAGTGLKDNDIKSISEIRQLTTLDIGDNSISDKGVAHLVNLPFLTHLWISSKNVTPQCIESLRKMERLRGLVITPYNWTPQEREKFVRSLKRSDLALDIN